MISELLSGLLGVLIGGVIGHRLALGRDKRKEFNETSDSLFERLEKQRLLAEKGAFPDDANNLDNASFIDLKRKVPCYKKQRLNGAVDRYMDAKQICGQFEKGRYNFSNPDILIEAISGLQKLLPHK